jgi:hypothetical protein
LRTLEHATRHGSLGQQSKTICLILDIFLTFLFLRSSLRRRTKRWRSWRFQRNRGLIYFHVAAPNFVSVLNEIQKIIKFIKAKENKWKIHKKVFSWGLGVVERIEKRCTNVNFEVFNRI